MDTFEARLFRMERALAILQAEIAEMRARRVRPEFCRQAEQRDATAMDILRTVSVVFGLPVEEMLQRTHISVYVRARSVAMHFIRKLRGLSWTQIGQLMRVHHTTCMARVRALESQMQADQEFAAKVREVERLLTTASAPLMVVQGGRVLQLNTTERRALWRESTKEMDRERSTSGNQSWNGSGFEPAAGLKR